MNDPLDIFIYGNSIFKTNQEAFMGFTKSMARIPLKSRQKYCSSRACKRVWYKIYGELFSNKHLVASAIHQKSARNPGIPEQYCSCIAVALQVLCRCIDPIESYQNLLLEVAACTASPGILD